MSRDREWGAQKRCFPDAQLGALLDVTDALQNRPSFEVMVDVLDDLFVGLLRYERDRRDISQRADLPESTHSPRVMSVASLGGVQVCAVERHGSGFHPGSYRKIFRLYSECILFVHSQVDDRVRVLLRPRKGQRTYRYRSIVPRNSIGPRSDRGPSWALRFGLLSPDLEAPAHANYEVFEDIIFESPACLLEAFDPYTFENSEKWGPRLGISPWSDSLPSAIERFIQRGKPLGERRVRGLHEALLRAFPMYIEGDWNQRLIYQHYSVVSCDGEPGWEIIVKAQIVDERGESTSREEIRMRWALPPMTSTGLLQLDGERYRFKAAAGGEPNWEDEATDHQNQLDEVIEDELGDLEEPDDENAPSSAEEIREEFGSRPSGEDLIGWNEVFDEKDEGSEAVRFLSLERALGYAVSNTFGRLRYYLRHFDNKEDRPLKEHVRRISRLVRVRQNPESPQSIISDDFLDEYFECVQDEEVKTSPFGRALEAHAVKSDLSSRGAPPWSCRETADLFPNRFLPAGESLRHPVRRDLVADENEQRISTYAKTALQNLKVSDPTAAIRALCVRDRRECKRLLVVPGRRNTIIARRDTNLASAPVSNRLRLRRRFVQGIPIPSAPRTLQAGSGDGELPFKIQPDPTLDPNTGLIESGFSVEQGQPLAARAVPRRQVPLTSQERLLSTFYFGDEDKAWALGARDRSWYLPRGAEGVVADVEFTGDKESGRGTVSVEIVQESRLREGMRLCGTSGISGRVTEVRPAFEMPYDEQGEPFDAVISIREDFYAQINDGHTFAFDPDGQPIDEASSMREVDLSVVDVGHQQSRQVAGRPNVWGRRFLDAHQRNDDVLPILGQLDALSCQHTVEQLIAHLDAQDSPEAAQLETEEMLAQVMEAAGFSGQNLDGDLLVELDGPDTTPELCLSGPTETFNYRTKEPERGGLFDPLYFEPTPGETFTTAGIEWMRLDARSARLRAKEVGSVEKGRQSPDEGRVGAIRVRWPQDSVPGNAYIDLPGPVMNPLAEPALAEFFGVSLRELAAVASGEATLIHGESGGEQTFRVEEIEYAHRTANDRPAYSGVRGIERRLTELAQNNRRASQLLDAVWNTVPVVPPVHRPLQEDPEAPDGWAVSTLNDRYLGVAHVADRYGRVLGDPEATPYTVLILAREQLRTKVHDLVGSSQEFKKEKGNREKNNRQAPGFDGSIIDRWNRLVQRRLYQNERVGLPHSASGPWRTTSQDVDLRIPLEAFIDCWFEKVVSWVLEEGVRELPQTARNAAHLYHPDVIEVCTSKLSGDKIGGYLVTESSVVLPVDIRPSITGIIEVSEEVAAALGLAADEELTVYLPAGEKPQNEVRNAIGRRTLGRRYAAPSGVVKTVLSQCGYLTGADAEDGNLGTQLVSALTRWPARVQREFVERLRDGALKSEEDIESFVERFESVGSADEPLEYVRSDGAALCEPGPRQLWQMVDAHRLEQLASTPQCLCTDDFLSKLVMGRFVEDESPGEETSMRRPKPKRDGGTEPVKMDSPQEEQSDRGQPEEVQFQPPGAEIEEEDEKPVADADTQEAHSQAELVVSSFDEALNALFEGLEAVPRKEADRALDES